MIDSELRRRLQDLCSGGPVLIATDFDGTLTPIVSNPASAVLEPSTVRVLERLASSDRALLFVISGRPLSDLRERVQVGSVLAGNHGLEVEGPGYRFQHPAAEALRPRLAEVCMRITKLLSQWPGGWLEDKGLTATVHYRAVAERQQHSLMIAVRRCLGPYAGEFGLRAGKKALEIHPRVGWNKGSAVNWLREASGISACICIGDDRTDESMFRECSGALTVFVGRPRFTEAQFRVESPADVEQLLGIAADELQGSRAAAAPHPIAK